MQIRKLFRVLVAGGAILGGVVGCGGASANSQGQTNSPTSGGDGGPNPDGGMPGGGGGTHGW
jgi:hypothetical protein